MYARYIPPPKATAAPKTTTTPPPPPDGTKQAVPSPNPAPPADGTFYTRYVPPPKTPVKTAPQTAVKQYFAQDDSPPADKRKREAQDEAVAKFKKSNADKGVNVAAKDENGSKKKKNRRKRKQRTRGSDCDSDDSEHEVSQPQAVDDESSQVAIRPKTKSESNIDATPSKSVDGKGKNKDRRKSQTQEATDLSEAGQEDDIVNSAKSQKKEKKEKKKKTEKHTHQDVDSAPEAAQDDIRHKTVLERKEKSLKLANMAPRDVDSEAEASDAEATELHGLEPLPQPAPVPDDETKPTYDTLPPWLANPMRVDETKRMPFSELGIPAKTCKALEKKGLAEAFAVQTAVLHLLTPTAMRRAGDVLICAPTGSGKTLAYALPVVDDISQSVVTRLRALVVLPTRELVKQAYEVLTFCASAYQGAERKTVRIGMAVGNQSLKSEQEKLIESETRYDPEECAEIEREIKQREAEGMYDVPGMEFLGDEDAELRKLKSRLHRWTNHAVFYSSRVDVLVCTPGRLVEHLEETAGFSLEYVRWLVVDEADKLLAQNYQGWLEAVMEQQQQPGQRDFSTFAYTGPRKVVVSATLARDYGLVAQLQLRRPTLVVVESRDDVAGSATSKHSLPLSLREFSVRVPDTQLKPLYLLELLRSGHMEAALGDDCHEERDKGEEEEEQYVQGEQDKDEQDDGKKAPPHSLIFTKSNEAAIRLSRLLVLIDTSLVPYVATMTSTTPTHQRRKTLQAFASGSDPLRLLVASDLVARGIDIPHLAHVVNYDVAPSLAAYVHRVGRTARAGRPGCSFTLVGDSESGWFWKFIGKSPDVARAAPLGRVNIDKMGEECIKSYEEALERLGAEAQEMKRP